MQDEGTCMSTQAWIYPELHNLGQMNTNSASSKCILIRINQIAPHIHISTQPQGMYETMHLHVQHAYKGNTNNN